MANIGKVTTAGIPTTQTLSKSQKKRMKAKASKAKQRERQQREKAAAAAAAAEDEDDDDESLGNELEEEEEKKKNKKGTEKLNGRNPILKGESLLLNPHDKIRFDLIKLGFTHTEIDIVLEEMWNMQLKYDEFDSVLSYLESRESPPISSKESEEKENVVKVFHETDDETEQISAVESVATSITAATNSSSNNIIVKSENSSKEMAQLDLTEEPQSSLEQQHMNVRDMKQEVAAVEDPIPSESAGTKKRPRNQPQSSASSAPRGIGEKLDMVSSHESLSDAIFALKEWVIRVATAEEIAEFCNAQTTRALPNVIHRCILETDGDSTIDAILDLIEATLRSSGMPSISSVAAKKALEAAILKARTASNNSSSMDLSKSVALGTANFISSVLAKTASATRSTSADDTEETIRKIEKEINELTTTTTAAEEATMATTTTNGGGREVGIVELMTRRDHNKVTAEKYSTILRLGTILINQETVTSTNVSASLLKQDDDDDEETRRAKLMASLLGEQQQQTNRAEALKMRVANKSSSSYSQRESLVAELGVYRSERDTIVLRIKELRLELNRLEQQESNLNSKVLEVEGKIASMIIEGSSSSSAMQDLRESKLDGRSSSSSSSEHVNKVEDEVKEVAIKLQAFEFALFEASNAERLMKRPNNNDGNTAFSQKELGTTFKSYLERMKSYFVTEAECIEFMLARVKKLESSIPDLQREIEECAALKMTTNVTQMTQTLKRKTQRHIIDDIGIAKALRGEAMTMKIDLMTRLEEYNNNISLMDNNSVDGNVLRDIVNAMSRIGIDIEDDEEKELLLLGLYSAPGSSNNTTAVNGTGTVDDDDYYEQHISSNNETNEMNTKVDNSADIRPLMTTTTTTTTPMSKPAPSIVAIRHGNPKVKEHPIVVAMPKLSWATKASNGSKKAHVKSLRDIQKEEEEEMSKGEGGGGGGR